MRKTLLARLAQGGMMLGLRLADERGIHEGQFAALRSRQRTTRVLAKTDGAVPAGRDALAEMRDQLPRQALGHLAQIHDLMQACDLGRFAGFKTLPQSRGDGGHGSLRSGGETVGVAQSVGTEHRVAVIGELGEGATQDLFGDAQGRC